MLTFNIHQDIKYQANKYLSQMENITILRRYMKGY